MENKESTRARVEEAVAYLKEHLYDPDFQRLNAWVTMLELLLSQLEAMEQATAKDVDRMERAAIQVESLNEECNRLKAQLDEAQLAAGRYRLAMDQAHQQAMLARHFPSSEPSAGPAVQVYASYHIELMRANQLLLNQTLNQNTRLRLQLEDQSVIYQDNLTEIQLLKAQVVSREKEVDTMMAQRNLAEAKVEEMQSFELMLRNDVSMLRDESARRQQVNADLTVLVTALRSKDISYQKAIENLKEVFAKVEQREVGYLSELDDYARTVLTLRSQVKACEAEHGTRNDYDKV